MVKARLTTGEIIELPKDCECITHEGPHWLHLDRIDRQRAAEALESGAYTRHIALSLERLQRKEAHMVRLGIEEILYA